MESVIESLKDEKYENTPISELYAVFRTSVKQEPLDFPSPPLPLSTECTASVEIKPDELETLAVLEHVEPSDALLAESEVETKKELKSGDEPASDKLYVSLKNISYSIISTYRNVLSSIYYLISATSLLLSLLTI